MSDAPERIWADWSPADEDTMPATLGCYTPNRRDVPRWKRVDYVRADLVEALKTERDLLRALLAEADRRIAWEAVGFGNDFADQVQAALKGATP